MKRSELQAGERYAVGGRERRGIDEVTLLSTAPVMAQRYLGPMPQTAITHPVTGETLTSARGRFDAHGRHLFALTCDGTTVILVTPGQIIGPWESIQGRTP